VSEPARTAAEAEAAALAAAVASAAATDEADLEADNWSLGAAEDGLPKWRNSVSGHVQACKPTAVLESELRKALRAAKRARARAAAWSADRDRESGLSYWLNSETGESTWVKPDLLRKLHAAEFHARVLPARAECEDWLQFIDEDEEARTGDTAAAAFWENERTGATARARPEEFARLERMEAAEAERLAREEAADWAEHEDDDGAKYYENLADESAPTTYERPACLDAVAAIEAAAAAAEARIRAEGGMSAAEAAAAQAALISRARSDLHSTRRASRGRSFHKLGGASSHERRDAAAQDALLAGALDETVAQLRAAGLASSQLAVFVDLTSHNKTQGARSFGGRGLHDVSDPASPNPYQQVIAVLTRALAPFDSDGLIPLYGFGCSQSLGKAVVPLHLAGSVGAPGSDEPERFCKGLTHVVAAYSRRMASGAVKFKGPTSFGPAIRKTIELSVASGARELTICLILACSQVEARIATEAALVDASEHPIAIVVVGVGDGPFDDMARLDDDVGSRRFDNLTFVEFEKVKAECSRTGAPLSAALALACLAEIPDVVAACERLGYIGNLRKAAKAQALAPRHRSAK
jgi:hypothetical protein